MGTEPTTLHFDDDRSARRLERSYATPDIVAQRAAVLDLLAPAPGERVLDVGSGPGYLLASLADAVGRDGSVRGIDRSPAMNALAAARTAGLSQVSLTEGDALALPAADASLDAVVSTQVYEYVTDLAAAFAEVRRVLRPGGRFLVLDTDWDSLVWHVGEARAALDRHRRVVDAWEEHLVHPRLPRALAGLLRTAGLTVTSQHVVPLLNTELTDDTFSSGLIGLVTAFVPGRRGVTAQDAVRWREDLTEAAAAGEYFFSLNRYAVLAERP